MGAQLGKTRGHCFWVGVRKCCRIASTATLHVIHATHLLPPLLLLLFAEAGEGEDGRMKSAIGIGALLMDGLGDTIRVSLTGGQQG